jgi:crotonobetainyl-CoA:carnitine CoA-transferase CaiB-like acyl-CoA transferase
MQRLQLGAAEMTTDNPGLIYCSIPGFASDDPRAALYAREGVVGAAAGLYASRDGDPREQPIYNTLPLASCFGALIAANSIVAALIARERSGFGQAIEVSMFEASFELTRYYGDRTPGAAHPRIRLGATTTMALTQHYQCKDGRFVHLSWLEGRQLDAFARLTGLHQQWSSAGLLDHARVRSDRGYSAQLRTALAEVFKTRNAADWMALANPDADLAQCLTSEEWLVSDPHARETRAVIALEDPELGTTQQAGYPISMSVTPLRARGPRHVLGADAPPHWDTPSSFLNSKSTADTLLRHPLEGVRAVDLTQILAGPTACRILAEYGADVVQIVNPHARAGRDFHFSVNNGKRSMLLDLKQPGAMDVFRRLIEQTDVVSTNFSSEVGTRLGVDETSVRLWRPDVIYSRISAYGLDGPMREFRGHDQVGQAVTGMEIRWASDYATPLMQPHPLNDFGTGQLAAFAIMLALLHRARTGQGQLVGASLAQTATFLQTPYMLAYRGKNWSAEPGGQRCLGVGPLERLYRAEDRWLFVAARSLDELRRVPDLADLADATQLTERFAALPAAVWVERLTAAGNGAQVLSTPPEAMLDEWAIAHGVSRQVEFPEAGRGTIVGPSQRLSRTPVRVPEPTPPPGWHGRELLEELGFGQRIAELEHSGAVVLSQASEQLSDPVVSGQRVGSG